MKLTIYSSFFIMIFFLSCLQNESKEYQFRKNSQISLLKINNLGSIPLGMFNNGIDIIYVQLTAGSYNSAIPGDTVKTYKRINSDTITYFQNNTWGYSEVFEKDTLGVRMIVSGSCIQMSINKSYINDQKDVITCLNFEDTIGFYSIKDNKIEQYTSAYQITYFSYENDKLLNKRTIYKLPQAQIQDSTITEYKFYKNSLKQTITHQFQGKDKYSTTLTFKNLIPNKEVIRKDSNILSELTFLTLVK